MKKSKVDSAILIVLIAGIFWSFGALVVRFIEDARSVPWQYLFFRGSTIFILINIYLFVNTHIYIFEKKTRKKKVICNHCIHSQCDVY